MFESTTGFYDLMYAHKDYVVESAWVTDAVRTRTPDARTLLDVACGTGSHLRYLTDHFACQGVDLSEPFVAIAAERAGVPVHPADMDDFDLGETFDVVVCLFSSIGYSRDLNAAIGAMTRHLNPGGLLVVEPWFTPDQWVPGRFDVLDHEADGTRLVRMTRSGVDGNVALMDMHYLIADQNGIEHRQESHRMTLFTFVEYEAAFRGAGLTYEMEQPGPFGRGALFGLAPR